MAAGVEAALADAADAVIVLDADGQHPPELIPRFLEAAEHERGRDRQTVRATTSCRRCGGWRTPSRPGLLSLVVRTRLRDSQNGMRLFRASALRDVPPLPGRYEAETRHLKALIRSGRDIAWVPMPAIYAGEPSSFRAVADTLRVMGAVLAPAPRAPPGPRPG